MAELVVLAAEVQQSSSNFEEALSQTYVLFETQRRETMRRHQERLQQAVSHMKQRIAHARELYHQQTFQQLMLDQKECMRDLWAQQSDSCQARMITATLMFGCCFTIVSDGISNIGMQDATTTSSMSTLVRVVAFLMGLGFVIGLLAPLVTLVLYMRLSQYDVDHPLRRYESCQHVHRTFGSYYSCRCEALSTFSLWLTFLSSANVAASSVSLVAISYETVYHAMWKLESILLVLVGGGFAAVALLQLFSPDSTVAPQQPSTRRTRDTSRAAFAPTSHDRV